MQDVWRGPSRAVVAVGLSFPSAQLSGLEAGVCIKYMDLPSLSNKLAPFRGGKEDDQVVAVPADGAACSRAPTRSIWERAAAV